MVLDFLDDYIEQIKVGGVAIAVALVLGVGCGISGIYCNNFEYSKGVRTGMINKVSEKGLIWKTYEGQMALEGIVSGDNSVGANVWDFSIDREARHGENAQQLLIQMQNYLDSGTKVKMTYIQPLSTWPWRSSTKFLIQKVDPVKTEKELDKQLK